MDVRTCTDCGQEFPLDGEHYRWREKDGNGYFTAACRLCLRKQKRAAQERKKAKRATDLQKIEEAGVDLYLKAAARGGSAIPHSAEVIERVMEYFGGVAGFSAVMVKQYWDSPPGSSARNKLLETMCRLVAKNVEQGGAKKPLSMWTDEELEQELNDRFTQAVQAFTGTTIDVQPQAPKRIAQEEAPEGVSTASAAQHPAADPVPAAKHQGHPGRTAGAEVGSPATVPTEPEPREDPRLQGE